ncbi:DUF928 domain-containing protein [Brasilonema sp. UFV-L1]|uniref:DUF928 domain-containing protein n=1 Tax=Brasilonema sp. UFV-L1 TaxID=2234130 RepID=UPI00145F5236|nr:DUF928 domain-containing protein [Brasilonema sp. UFV-L1]NMG09200.1 hypothetical protein [Brasilonema sp. UFV-L1]
MKLAGVIPVILLCLASYSPQVHAQVVQPVKNKNANTQNRLEKLNFPRSGAPTGRRQGAASRNGCPDVKQPVTALVPGEGSVNESISFLTLTVSEYPTFWVYLPDLPTNLRSGEFVFQDERGRNIYKTFLTLPQKSGVIGMTLPQNPQYALRQDNKYQWYFKVYCGNPENTSDYYYVKAWVQKVALTPNLESQLKAAKPEEYTVYAVNQIWQDALTSLADMRRTNSGSSVLTQDWTNLLKAVGLEEFANAPIVGRYGVER